MCGPRPGPCGPRPGQVGPQPLHGGTPPQCKAKPLRGRLQRALHCSSPVPVAAQVLRGGPAPTKWGLWGRPPLRPRPAGPGPVKLGRSRCTGAPLRNARPSPCGAACSGPCIAPPPCRLRRRCSGAARPPQSGGCGAVRPSGPALRAGVAARGPSLGVPPPSRAGAPAAGCCCSPCPCGGPQFKRRPLGPRKRGLCPLCGRLGRKDTPAAAGYLTGDLMPRPSPCGAACSGP